MQECQCRGVGSRSHQECYSFRRVRLQNAKLLETAGSTASDMFIVGLGNHCIEQENTSKIYLTHILKVRKLFTRYFVSEFGDDSTVVSLENTQTIHNFMRFIQGTADQRQEWRDIRGYMLPEDLQIIDDQLVITGIWRGSNGISANQLIHITGLDDFEIARIELVHPQRNKRNMDEEELVELRRDENIAVTLFAQISGIFESSQQSSRCRRRYHWIVFELDRRVRSWST